MSAAYKVAYKGWYGQSRVGRVGGLSLLVDTPNEVVHSVDDRYSAIPQARVVVGSSLGSHTAL